MKLLFIRVWLCRIRSNWIVLRIFHKSHHIQITIRFFTWSKEHGVRLQRYILSGLSAVSPDDSWIYSSALSSCSPSSPSCSTALSSCSSSLSFCSPHHEQMRQKCSVGSRNCSVVSPFWTSWFGRHMTNKVMRSKIRHGMDTSKTTVRAWKRFRALTSDRDHPYVPDFIRAASEATKSFMFTLMFSWMQVSPWFIVRFWTSCI